MESVRQSVSRRSILRTRGGTLHSVSGNSAPRPSIGSAPRKRAGEGRACKEIGEGESERQKNKRIRHPPLAAKGQSSVSINSRITMPSIHCSISPNQHSLKERASIFSAVTTFQSPPARARDEWFIPRTTNPGVRNKRNSPR